MKPRYILLYLTVLAFASCYPPEEPITRVKRYPMAAGNQWHYQRVISVFNFRPVVTGTASPETTFIFSTDVNVVGQVTLNGIETWKVQTVENENGNSLAAYDFYKETPDTLYLVAYSGISAEVYPEQKYREPVTFSYGGFTSRSFTELVRYLQGYRRTVSGTGIDSITYEEGPVIPFAFPLQTFMGWNYRTADFSPGWRIFKRVSGLDFMRVNQIIYPVFKIEWFWDTHHSGVWDPNMDGYDFFSTNGLLRREFILKNFVLLGSNSPTDTLGLFDYREDYIVQSMSVQTTR